MVLVLELFELALQDDQIDVFRVQQLVRVLQPLLDFGQVFGLALESALQLLVVVRELVELLLAVDQFLRQPKVPRLSPRAPALIL